MHNAHILALQGVENFRDLGGYSVGNGTIVKWGRLFRSGHLAELSEFDCQQLSPLNISSIFDLRAPSERKAFPTRWHGEPEPSFFTIDLHQDDSHPAAGLFEQIMKGSISRAEVEAHLLEDYARMPFEFSPILKALFAKLLQPHRGAVVIHCTAGKDRTGCVVALLLTLLGVPQEKVIEDYLLSNEGFAAEQKLSHIADKFRRKVDNIEDKINALRPLVQVQPHYLEAAFSAILQEMGSMERYFESVLELTPDQVTQIKKNLLRETISL